MDSIVQRSGKDFAGNVLKLFAGSALAQGLYVLVAPVLARLYDPADFGLHSIFISIAGVLSTISCLRYENAIVLPEEDEEDQLILDMAPEIDEYYTMEVA